MEEKYIVFDVETPNAANDRICSIGITEIKNGNIIKTQNILVNPECGFDLMNIRIHGINERDVMHSETFPHIWQEIRSLFFDRVVIAHNACFDLSVLRKTLVAYGLDNQMVYFLDTVKAARDIYPNLPNFKLNTLCDYLGISLDHHDSGSDCRATAEVFLDMCHRGLQVNNYIRLYALDECGCSSEKSERKNRLSSESHALLELQSILESITDDGKIDLDEMTSLHNWIDLHEELSGNYPYDTIYRQIGLIIEDGIIEEKELDDLLNVCRRLIDPLENGCVCKQASVDVNGKNVVLSGEFSLGSKSKVESILIDRGATIQKSVTSKTHVVLVGSLGNNAWVAGNYGTKVKKAMELQAKGLHIDILKESDYFTNEVENGK